VRKVKDNINEQYDVKSHEATVKVYVTCMTVAKNKFLFFATQIDVIFICLRKWPSNFQT